MTKKESDLSTVARGAGFVDGSRVHGLLNLGPDCPKMFLAYPKEEVVFQKDTSLDQLIFK